MRTEVASKCWRIVRTLELDASPERVWTAITDTDELARWFPDRARLDLSPGGTGVFSWDGHGDFQVRVVALDAPRQLTWRWTGNDGRSLEEYSTLVEWTVTPTDEGGTTLVVRESGFDSERHHGQNTGGWTHELEELVAYLAT